MEYEKNMRFTYLFGCFLSWFVDISDRFSHTASDWLLIVWKEPSAKLEGILR